MPRNTPPPSDENSHFYAAERLAEAIHTAAYGDAALRARTAALGEKIRAENGAPRAVEVIERHAAHFSQRLRVKVLS